MYPLTCPDDKKHDFQEDPNDLSRFICTSCGVIYERFVEEEEKLENLKNLIKQIAFFTNKGSSEIFTQAFIGAMYETHNTIQQNFFRSLAMAISNMKDIPSDLRNAAAKEWCAEVSKIPKNFPRI